MMVILVMKELTHELLGYKNIKIIQNEDMFSFSLDSMLLADFVEPNYKTKKIIDLGCGNAPIPLFLTLKTDAHIVGVEIQEQVADMAKRSVQLNGLEHQIEIINADIKGIYRNNMANVFDIVISNPPYFKFLPSSNINKNDYLTIARHEVKITLEEIVNEAKKLLIDGGNFYMVHRVERLDEIIVLFLEYGFAIKEMRFIYTKKSSEDALLVLIKAKKNGKQSLKVLQPLYCYDEKGEYTEEVKRIFNFKK